MIVIGDEVGQWQVGRIEDAGLAAEKLEQTRRFLDNEARVGALAQRSVQKKDARRGIERPQTKRRLCVEIFGAQCGKMVRSEEHTSELQSLMRISYAVFCLKKKKRNIII